MTETERQSDNPRPCVACGKPTLHGDYCAKCIDRGFGGSCPGCEGLPLADVEED